MKLEVSTFRTRCSDKAQALKVLEESAEVFGAWQETLYPLHETVVAFGGANYHIEKLADEIADVITAACNLAERYNIDLQAALDRCEQHNRERGRYGKGN